MASWCLTVSVSAQGPSSVPVSEMNEIDLTAEDREAIEALAASYSKFALAGDFDSWLLLYREDAVRMNPGMPPLDGREAISQWINSMDITVLASKLSVSDIEGTRELAFVRGAFLSELSINLGGEELIIPDEGSWLSVVKRDEQDTWRFYRFISNTDLAPGSGD
jgi:ketosteroid isomerase-like protein